MNKFWTILSHTYLNKLKSKQFLISSGITLFIIIILSNMTNIIDFFNKNKDIDKVAVIDNTNILFEEIKESFHDSLTDIELELFHSADEENIVTKIEEGTYKGLLIIDFDNDGFPTGVYKSMTLSNTSIYRSLSSSLQSIKTKIATEDLNLSNEEVEKLNSPIIFLHEAVEKSAKSMEELSEARGLVYILLFFIYFSVVMYSNLIAMEVATEKSSRVMELLISSVNPVIHMFAKIIAMGLLGLSQLIVILSVGVFSMKKNLSSADHEFFMVFGFQNIEASTIIYALIFFILGYFLYATFAALLGSLVSRVEDIQQMITPMMLLIVGGFMISVIGLGQPDTKFIALASYFPFFTPMIMFMRVGMLNLSLWEPLLGITILLISIVIMALLGARIYRGGVLMYGKTSVIKSIKKAFIYSKN